MFENECEIIIRQKYLRHILYGCIDGTVFTNVPDRLKKFFIGSSIAR
ncbi:hypothetical protein [Thalassoporum mexicanum]|nr:hypothetical protein [Pseudanabaena sp. PCC 7367]